MTHTVLVDEARQMEFADLSGDFNPLHVDRLQSRRSQFGATVVHGVHLVLLALESIVEPGYSRIVRLDARFRNAVLVGEEVDFVVSQREDGRVVSVQVASQVRAEIFVQLVEARSNDAVRVGRPPASPSSMSAATLTLDQLSTESGFEKLVIVEPLLATLFPRLQRNLSHVDLAALLASTRIVGMRCPGEWALFRRLEWNPREVELPSDQIQYSVAAVDKRFSMVTLEMLFGRSALRAEVILRSPPPKQPSVDSVSQWVSSEEFTGARALVVGGSRGIGELAAKVVVAGGGHVLLTYRSGRSDAEEVQRQLGANADSTCLDVSTPSSEALSAITRFKPTHLLYFATPIIARQVPGSWDAKLFDAFTGVYVTAFERLLHFIDDLGSLRGVLFPSSVFIDERPAGFSEYIEAKLAGEALCRDWQKAHPAQRVVLDRLPALVTDQTSAKLGNSTSDNIAKLMRPVRQAMTNEL